MSVELLELCITEAAAAAGDTIAAVDFAEPTVLLAAHVIAHPWTGGEAILRLGTPDEPELLGRYTLTNGLTFDVANLPWPTARFGAAPSYSRLLGAGLVGAIVAQLTGSPSEVGSGDVHVRLLVGVPQIEARES